MTMTDTSEGPTLAPTGADRLRSPVISPLRKNGGDLAHFVPQTRPQRVAKELLDYVFEEGDKMGAFLADHPQCFAENGPMAFRILLAWAHHEIEQPPHD